MSIIFRNGRLGIAEEAVPIVWRYGRTYIFDDGRSSSIRIGTVGLYQYSPLRVYTTL